MLHDVTGEGGLGFCYEALPDLLPWGYHGPLIVALDSNVLIELQQHGNAILNEEDPAVDADYATELDGLAEVLNVWMLRDVRFVVTPRALTDAKKNSERLMERQRPAIDAGPRTVTTSGRRCVRYRTVETADLRATPVLPGVALSVSAGQRLVRVYRSWRSPPPDTR